MPGQDAVGAMIAIYRIGDVAWPVVILLFAIFGVCVWLAVMFGKHFKP